MCRNIFPVPSKKALKKLGYLKDQKGIVNRFMVEEGWKLHTQKTRNFIIDSLKDQDFKVVSVLGSGWFLDVPVDFLLDRFEKIYCFDINHPRQITHKYRKETRIEFIEADITGGLIEKLTKTKNINLEDIPNIQSREMEGFFISLNLLSQLDNLLFEYSSFDSKNENKIREQIQKKHLEFLSQHPHLLITDYEEIYRDENGNEVGRKPTVYTELPKSKNVEKWTWEFDTNKTYKNDCATELNVIAINNLK